MLGGKVMYPVYCICVSKSVVQVPTGGLLKLIVMFPSTGDLMTWRPSSVSGGGYCVAPS